jgi:hypothetical protein
MIASHVSREILESAAVKVGVRAEIRTLNQKGTRHNVKLFPQTEPSMFTPAGRRRTGEQGDARYQRESVGMNAGRRVNAVCWHGFRDYFRAVYEQDAAVTFRTAVDTWRNAADFEQRFAASGHRNIGSQMFPQSMADACRCPDRGYAG